MLRKKKSIIPVTFAIAWAAFTFVDFLEEKTSFISRDFQGIVAYFIPLVIVAAYFVVRWLERQIKVSGYEKYVAILLLKMLGQWLVMSIVTAITITALALNNVWIVHQNIDLMDLLDFFNGMEYYAFGILLAVIPIGCILIGEILIWIVKILLQFYHRQRQ